MLGLSIPQNEKTPEVFIRGLKVKDLVNYFLFPKNKKSISFAIFSMIQPIILFPLLLLF